MKKLIAVVALAATVGLFGMQEASAQKGMGRGGYGPGDCWRANQQNVQVLDEETQKARDAFFDATKDLRKEMFTKRAEMRALMSAENPNEKKVAALAGEMFELRTKIQAQAAEAGLKGGPGVGGFGCDGPRGGGYGKGPGSGAGYGCDGAGPCGGRGGYGHGW
ncbi:MAG: periplasmic heavy metal sensor [Desulfobulbaceae bacterium]|nr:periplasmic heavy metal sensor [Desulfobulbaceae bacterium]